MQRTVSVYSKKQTQEEVFQEIYDKIVQISDTPILIVFFAEYNFFWYVANNLKKKFPSAITIGSTSYLNFINNDFGHVGASAMAIFSGIECAEGVLFEINRHPSNYIMHIRNAVNSLTTYENTCCLQFNTAFSKGEELVMDTFEEGLEGKPITVFGGSSGASLDEDKTFVSLNGEIYKNSCVFCLIHNLDGKIAFYKENIFKPTKNRFITTDVDCDERRVYEFNDKPAADVLADILKVSIDELPEAIKKHPFGRIVNDNVYITDISKINSDGSVDCLTTVYNRANLALLELDDIERVWKETIIKTKELLPNPSFSLVVNCLERSTLFEEKNIIDEFMKNLSDNFGSFIGLSGYGEQFDFTHLNHTMIVALFE